METVTPSSKTLRLLLLLSVWFLLSGTFTQAQEWELRICGLPNHLPYSSQEGGGFETRIAEIVAAELSARPVYVWLPRQGSNVREMLILQGECDLVMGINDGNGAFLTSIAYYRTSYVFVFRKDSPFSISSMDDPILEELRIGVQVAGRGVGAPTIALANRDLLEQQVSLAPDYDDESPLSHLVTAVTEGEVDVAIVWGPVAGFFAARQPVPLEVVPVTPQIERPFVPLFSSISIGVRPGDVVLRDRINVALARRWEEIQTILREYDVPLLPLPAPTVGGG